jgi:histidinol dehydrogenase
MQPTPQVIALSQWQRNQVSNRDDVSSAVANILAQITADPDASDLAVDQFSLKFDGFKPEFIELKQFEQYPLATDVAEAMLFAANNIEQFARYQRDSISSTAFQNEYGQFKQKVVAIDAMAAYIPAGRYPLVSTALMTLIPAKVAGVKHRIGLTTSDSPEMLAAMSLAGATQVLKIGGVQAIAAASLGYKDLMPVDCIVGPGNAYVAEAKKQLSLNTRIDSVAGPSELLIWADDSANLDWVITDMLAQAEHDPMAQSVFVSQDNQVCDGLLKRLLETEDGQKLLDDNQVAILLADTEQQAIDFINDYAPEHFMVIGASEALLSKGEKISNGESTFNNAETSNGAEINNDADSSRTSPIKNYGSLFVGNNSAVAFGDYCAGPNHTLPTLGGAKQKGGLSVFDFIKILTEQTISDQGRAQLANASSVLARVEGLVQHQASADIRK